jgi:hypothetical protein
MEEISMPNSDNSKTATAPTGSGHKKPYAPPKLTSIKLRPEEAVLGTCKTPTGNGAGPSGACSLCGVTLAT